MNQLLLFEDVPAGPAVPVAESVPDAKPPTESDFARDLRLRMQPVVDHIRAAYAAGVKHHPYEYNGVRLVDRPHLQMNGGGK